MFFQATNRGSCPFYLVESRDHLAIVQGGGEGLDRVGVLDLAVVESRVWRVDLVASARVVLLAAALVAGDAMEVIDAGQPVEGRIVGVVHGLKFKRNLGRGPRT